MGKAPLKPAVNFTELPTTSTAVTGSVLVVIAGEAIAGSLPASPSTHTSKPEPWKKYPNRSIIVNTIEPERAKATPWHKTQSRFISRKFKSGEVSLAIP